ncbi:DMT family transporter [Methanococcoides alaskense]|uniref:Drug/metabolite transporter (DMT)-like permease n=1 Tax=Methanococcoides alaskense TaxID=325778 RepID=A0AA90TZU4_9EURY|nr:DMT family transporter [Methanococcoides alaskense]MDA0524800.1 DMT family transporter [Methanococcoides alaskense]MDR6223077.1 drug/metabolite transporter (DMT)-like permease [Methanococcoides alaskense]
MIPAEFLVILLGLASAAAWGAADFGGGFASKRTSEYSVVILMQAVGLILLPILAMGFSEQFPQGGGIFWGFVAGVAGSLGLVFLYRALSQGKMGVVAPVSAIITVALPVIYGAVKEGLPSGYQMAGFMVALVAMWMISSSDDNGDIRRQDIVLPLLAGVGFGIFFISVDMFSEDAVFWPLTVAKLSSVITILLISILTRSQGIPTRGALPLIILAGIFDAGGNLFFALASQVGRVDIATVVASLYPGSTVLLAWIFLKERLALKQWMGVVLALVAIVFISL